MRCLITLSLLSGLLVGCVVRPLEPEEPAGPGTLRVSPFDGRYLDFRGKPLILITSAEHYGAVINLDFDYERYLETLHQSDLNYTRIFTGAYVEREGSFGIEKNTLAPARGRLIAPWARSETPGYLFGGNKFDLERWDPEYFARLRDFVGQAGRRGIVVEVTLFSSIYSDEHWQCSPLHPGNNITVSEPIEHRSVHTLNNGGLLRVQEALVRKLVRELNQFDNVFFEIQNEPYADHPLTTVPLNPYLLDWRENWKNRVDLAQPVSLEWQKRMAAVVREEEASLPYTHLIAQNFCNFGFPLKEIDEGVSILNFHYAWPHAVHMNYGWGRVASFDESGFSGTDDDTYRRQAWRFVLAGGGIFNNLDYSFYPGAEDGTGTNRAPGGGSPRLRAQLKVLKDFIQRFDFINMGPERGVVHMSPGAYCQVLAASGRAYAIFVEGEGECELTLNLWWGGSFLAEWINTRNGVVEKAEEIEATGRTVLKSPRFDGDIALRLERR